MSDSWSPGTQPNVINLKFPHANVFITFLGHKLQVALEQNQIDVLGEQVIPFLDHGGQQVAGALRLLRPDKGVERVEQLVYGHYEDGNLRAKHKIKEKEYTICFFLQE